MPGFEQRCLLSVIVQARHSRFVSMHPCGAASSSANVKNIIRSFNHGMPSSLRPHTRHRQATDRLCKDCDFASAQQQYRRCLIFRKAKKVLYGHVE